MNRNLIIVLASIVAVVIVILVINIIMGGSQSAKLLSESETLTAGDFEIKIDDVYNADFARVDEFNYTFDKYLAIDFNIKNISRDEQHFNAFKKFYLDDGVNNPKHFLIDENEKKFGATLQPNEDFDLTLVFATDDADEYTLFYNKSLKAEDDKVIGFSIDGTDLQTKKVETTVDHVEIDLDDEDNKDDKSNDDKKADSSDKSDDNATEEADNE